jgi:hypothetical protein
MFFVIVLWCQPAISQHLKNKCFLCFAVFPFLPAALVATNRQLTQLLQEVCLTTATCLHLTGQTAQLKRQLVKVNTNDLQILKNQKY